MIFVNLGNALMNFCISMLIGTKRQKTMLLLSSIGMLLVCFPLSSILCFVFDYGFKGLIIGFILTYFVQSICFLLFCMTINWEHEIKITAERLALLKQSMTNFNADN